MAEFTDFTDGIDPLGEASAPTAPPVRGAKEPPPVRSAPKPTSELPSWKDDLAASVSNATIGWVNAAIPAIASKLPLAGAGPAGVVAGLADAGMMVAGAAAPIARRAVKGAANTVLPEKYGNAVGDFVGDAFEGMGELSPSAYIADKLANAIGDPSKGSKLAGAAGVAAGINPIGIAKKFLQGGVKEGATALGKNAAIGTGAVWGGEGGGAITSLGADVLLEKSGNTKLTEPEKESLKGLFAPLGGHTFGKVYDHVVGARANGTDAFNKVKEVTAAGNAEKRINQVEADAPPERTVDEQALAKNLMKTGGLTEEQALSQVKKGEQGVYGGVSKDLTRDVDHRIVDSVKTSVENAISNEPFGDSRDAIGVVNNAVKSFDSVKALLDTPATDETPARKQAALTDLTEGVSEGLKNSVPDYESLKSNPEFNDWLKGHDVSILPKPDRDGLASKYFIKDAIDTYYTKHVEPIKTELMAMDSGLKGMGEDFAHYVATEAESIADVGKSGQIYSKIFNEVSALDRLGRLDTVDGVYDITNSIENGTLSTYFKDNPRAKGYIKDKIWEAMPSEVQAKVTEFKQAYKPFGAELKQNTPMYKLATYDPTTTTNAKAASGWLDVDAPAEKFNTMLMLAKDSPDIAYSALHGVNAKMAEAYETKGFNGMSRVIKDHVSRMDALAQLLPADHPAKTAFNMMQGLLEVTKDADTISRQVEAAEKQAKSRRAMVDDVDKYVADLSHYGKYATESYTSLLAQMAQDPGMLAALKAQSIGGQLPLTHEVAKSLMESQGVNADLTKQKALVKALSIVQGTGKVIPDLIRHGISAEVAKFHEDGSLDHTATVNAMRAKGSNIRNYLKNLHEILDTTPGLDPAQVKQSKTYLEHVADALEVADNDIVNRVFQRVYAPSEKLDTRGEVQKTSGASVKKAAYSVARGNSNVYTIWSSVTDVIAHFFHGKDAIDAAVLKKLDDPAFVEQVSRLKKGYSEQRSSDVRRQAEEGFANQTAPAKGGLLDPLKLVMRTLFPGSSVAMDFMDKAKSFGNWYAKSAASILPFYNEKHRLQQRFNQNFSQPQQGGHEDEIDDETRALMNWKG